MIIVSAEMNAALKQLEALVPDDVVVEIRIFPRELSCSFGCITITWEERRKPGIAWAIHYSYEMTNLYVSSETLMGAAQKLHSFGITVSLNMPEALKSGATPEFSAPGAGPCSALTLERIAQLEKQMAAVQADVEDTRDRACDVDCATELAETVKDLKTRVEQLKEVSDDLQGPGEWKGDEMSTAFLNLTRFVNLLTRFVNLARARFRAAEDRIERLEAVILPKFTAGAKEASPAAAASGDPSIASRPASSGARSRRS